MPDLGGLIALPIIITVVVLIVVFVIVGRVMRSAGQDRKLLQTGEPAQATILQLRETGLRINEQPQIALTLEVRPTNRPAYQTEAKMIISYLQAAQFQPGALLDVRVDPADPNKVAIAGVMGPAMMGGGMGMMGQSPMQQQQTQQMLMEMEVFSNNLRNSGLSAPAKILNAANMGVNVNGNNPLMSFQLEVQPPGAPTFQAMAKGVIGESAVHKYQAGSTIWVKYDPDNTSQVALDHS
jgi:hypothetical protein